MDINVSVSNEIIKVLDYLFEKFGIAVDWTSDEIIPYLQTLGEHIVQYKLANAIFVSIILLIIGLIGMRLFCKMIKKCNSDDELTDLDCALGWVGGVVGVILLIIACVTINTAIKCLTLPEVVILDYIKNFSTTLGSSN